MIGGEDEEGGDVERSSGEYCSLSERIVTPDSAMGFEGSSDAIVAVFRSFGDNDRIKEGSTLVGKIQSQLQRLRCGGGSGVAVVLSWPTKVNARSWR